MNDFQKINWAILNAAGIAFDGNPEMYFIANKALIKSDTLFDQSALGMDSSLTTVANAGIPAALTMYIDPRVIDVMCSPLEVAKITGEELIGDWATDTAVFPIVEPTGQTATYDDFSEDGTSDANVSFPDRGQYRYQTNTKWGDLEEDRAGKAKLNWAMQKHLASVMTLQRFQNKSYAYGIAGLKNYGLLNDPTLSAPVTAGAPWVTATAEQIFDDIRIKLFQRLVKQSESNVFVGMNSKISLCMSAFNQVNLLKTNQFGISVIDLLKKAFPNIEIETAPEYSTDAGELVQMMVKDIGDGTETLRGAYSMKLRMWPIEIQNSVRKQKKAQSTWGTIIKRPFLIVQMLAS